MKCTISSDFIFWVTKSQAAAGTSEDKNSLTSFEGDEEGDQLQEFF